MRAKLGDKVIAESDKTLEVGGYIYFPRDTVKMDLLKITPKTASDLECPHGVQFYDVVLFFHIGFVVLAFGPTFAYPVFLAIAMVLAVPAIGWASGCWTVVT